MPSKQDWLKTVGDTITDYEVNTAGMLELEMVQIANKWHSSNYCNICILVDKYCSDCIFKKLDHLLSQFPCITLHKAPPIPSLEFTQLETCFMMAKKSTVPQKYYHTIH